MKINVVLTFCLFFCHLLLSGQTTFSSVQSGNWNDGGTWGNTSPGVQGADWPANTDNAVIADGTIVKLTAARTIDDLTINDGGEFDYESNTLTLSGTVTPPYVSVQSGDWDVAGSWLGSPGTPGAANKVIISRDHIVKLTGDEEAATLIINSGAVLDDDNSGELTINSALVLNGERQGKKKTILEDGVSLSGTGNHYSTKEIEITSGAAVTILSGTNLSVTDDFVLDGGSTVTNNGTISTKEVKDTDATDTWTNAAGSTLISLKDIMSSGGTLNASAANNTVVYAEQNNTDITVPSASSYYNLQIAGSLVKTMLGDLTILGDLSISSTLDTDAANDFSLTVKGDWTNSGTYTANNATVTLDGTVDQTITNSGGEIFYDLTINKSSGTLMLASDASVSNTLTMTDGNISTSTNVFTLGDATTNEGTLSHTSGAILGSFERWIAATTVAKLLFPVGTESLYVPAEPTFTDAFKTGGSLIVSFVERNPGSEGLSLTDGATTVYNTFVEGYWRMTPANSFDPGTGFDLDLTGTGMNSFAIEAATRILRRNNSTNDWVVEGAHSIALGDVAKRTTLTTLSSEYALGDDTNCTAPITYAITGDTEVCSSDTGDTYSVTLNSGNTYYWSVIGGTITSASSGVDVNSITVDWGGTGMIGNVNVYEENTCTRSDDVDLAVNINTLPTSNISGSFNVAEDQAGVNYSVSSNAGYTYTWAITGGTQVSGGTTNIITVDWADAGAGVVSVVASSSCAADAIAITLSVEIYSNVLSLQTGDWDDPNTWDCNCDPSDFQSVNVLDGHRVTLTGDETIQNITIDAGGVINQDDRKLKIEGNLILNGTITGNTGNKAVEIKGGAGTTLDGSGTLSSSGDLALKIKGEASIEATADLLIIGNVEIDDKRIVTNNGSITFNDNIEGRGAESVWFNAAGSYLKVGGEIFSTDGILKASSTDNTVEYATTDPLGATITTPLNATYFNLILSGAIDNETQDDLTILGDLTISSGGFDVATNGNNLTIEGDWNNQGTFSEGTQTVTFTGTNEQSISSISGETFYDLTINKSGGAITLANNVNASNALNMTIGNVVTGTNKLTLGTSTANEGTLSYTDGIVIGQFERWIDNLTTAQLLFPIGTAEHYRPAEITLSDVTKSGGTLCLQFVESNPGSTGLSLMDGIETIYNTFVEGYWEAQVNNGFTSGTSYDLELAGAGFSSFAIDADTRLLTRSNSIADWIVEGTHVAAVDPEAKRAGLTTMPAQFAFGDNTNCTPPTAPTFSGTTDVCKGVNGENYTITSSTAGLTDYTWSVVGGSIANGQGTGTVTINWGNTAVEGSVSLTVTNSCTSSEATSTMVNVNTIAPTSINGDLIVPANESGVIYAVEQRTGYTYNWTINGGTITSAASGVELDSITVDWGTAGTGQLSVTAQASGCTVTNALTIEVDKYVVIKSNVAAGDWSDPNSWDCICVPGVGDNPKILNGHTISLDGDETVNNLIIDAGGTLAMDATDRTLTIDGDLTVNGSITTPTLNSALDVILSGVGSEIGGTGTIDPSNGTGVGSVQIAGGNKTISSTAVLTIADADFEFGSAGISVTSNGSVSISNDLVGVDNTNIWTNGTNATLQVTGVLLANGILVASASGNTVNYSGAAQDVKVPISNQYFHLTIGGTGTKTLLSNTDIDGDLLLTGTGVLDITAANNFTLTVGGDWTCNSAAGDSFLEQMGSVTFDGTDEQTISGGSTETFYNLVFDNSLAGDAVIVQKPINVTNDLTMTDGQIVTDAINIIDVNANATLSFVNGSFIDGPLIRRVNVAVNATVEFPVGKNDEMHRAELTVLQADPTNTPYTVEYFATGPSTFTLPAAIDHVSAISYWNIEKGSSVIILSASVTLDYTAYDEVDVEADLRIVKDDGGTNWVDLGGTGTASPSGSITSTNAFTTFSEFTLASTSSDNPLPVELVSFSAKQFKDIITLKWTTASEINNDHFEIQRSSDGVNFERVGRVNGNGTKDGISNYTYNDYSPSRGIVYYRFKQIDYDGNFEFSPIIYVQNIFTEIVIYPNPVTRYSKVKLDVDPSLRLSATIYDLNGREQFRMDGGLDDINRSLGQKLSSINSGIYTIVIKYEGGQAKLRFVK